MTDNQAEWRRDGYELDRELKSLGFADGFGGLIAKNFGSPKATQRMSAYRYNVKPRSEELHGRKSPYPVLFLFGNVERDRVH